MQETGDSQRPYLHYPFEHVPSPDRSVSIHYHHTVRDDVTVETSMISEAFLLLAACPIHFLSGVGQRRRNVKVTLSQEQKSQINGLQDQQLPQTPRISFLIEMTRAGPRESPQIPPNQSGNHSQGNMGTSREGQRWFVP